MKKLFLLFICIIFFGVYEVEAQNSDYVAGFENALNSIWLSDENVSTRIISTLTDYVDNQWNKVSIAPQYARDKIGLTGTIEEQEEKLRGEYEIETDSILKVYTITTNKYLEQYINEKSFKYLISDEYYWAALNKNGIGVHDVCSKYSSDGTFIYLTQTNVNAGIYNSDVVRREGMDFIKDTDKLEQMFLDYGINRIDDIKIIVNGDLWTSMYIQSDENEYLIRLYDSYVDIGENRSGIWAPDFKMFTIYPAEEALKNIIKFTERTYDFKLSYETEATELQAEGLLNGNEKGLDLLKPLTRIEAAAMLLRAMGEPEEVSAESVGFIDVPSTHWGYGAAMKAQQLGIVNGVGNDLFAPDDKVTATQFATMVLRAANTPNFDWTTALDMIIQKGIITEENARTMDLFTRGDMAKIIYEARVKGLF